MSSATIPVKKNMIGVSKNGTLDYTKLEKMLGDLVLQKEDHVNAPAFIIRPDTVEETLTLLRDEAGFDHLSCVTAQEYEDRFESIYHLRKYDSPQHELGIVVPSPKNNPWNQSASSVFRTADWHEREAYDLVGIHYEGHPDLRRILLPDTWQGHPLSLDYDQNKPQIITLQEHENPLQHNVEDNTMFINIGPHHPATHGVLHLKTVLDGEHVVAVDPDIGYLHRCEEQMAQGLNYRYQIMPYPDRWDYASAGLLNEWAYARAAEDLVNIEVPEYAEILRTMGAELCRICAHFLAVGTFALDVYGDFTAIFMYAMRDREIVQSILEDLTGQRMMFNYFRLGGVVWDLPEPRSEFLSKIRIFLDAIPSGIQEYSDLMTSNEIFQLRCVDIGILSPDVARQYGVTGPVARGSGIDYDLRRDDPYGYYKNLDWDVVTNDGCDIYSRFLVRLGEVEQSAKIVDQCVSLLESWPEEDRIIQANVPRTIKPPADAEIYRAVEAAKGELGIYIRSDGTQQPARFKIRSPCFSNLSTLSEMAKGGLVPDLIAALGSLDIVLGEVDR
mgnify:FL=1